MWYWIERARLTVSAFKREQSSCSCAATTSAAAEGVGARRSATKSAIVKSVSCPTAEITGTEQAAMARATLSSLKVHKSSIDPPPRATMTTLAHPDLLKYSIPSAT